MGCGVAHGYGNDPVRRKGDDGNDAHILVAAQYALDGCAGSVAEGKDEGQGDEVTNRFQGLGILGKEAANGRQEGVRNESRKEDDNKGRSLCDDGVLPRSVPVLGAYLVANDDGRSEADAPREDVDQGGVADGCLVGGQIERAEFGHEEADDGEETRFAKDGNENGDANAQLVVYEGPVRTAERAPHVVGPERLAELIEEHENEERNPRGNGNGVACADAAHRSYAQAAKDEEAEEGDRNGQVDEENSHGYVRQAVGVRDVAERSLHEHGKNP